MTSLRHNGLDKLDHRLDSQQADSPRDGYLDAARDCILDVGWRRTTLTEVARRAGVSRMTIYRTWSDMQQLLGDLMTREWGGVVAATVAGEDPDAPAPERLVSDVVGTVRALRDNELFLRIVELDPELLLPYLLSRRGRSQDAILALTETQIRAGQAEGTIRAGNPTAIARALLLAAHGFVLSAHTMVDEDASEAELDAELGLLLTRTLAP
ncbi:MAG TPA: helix-turn-helix domain-containing protein [Nocardioides sp.]|nr:helix-turn-helix domain-containing protein [Nocardioides sp.]